MEIDILIDQSYFIMDSPEEEKDEPDFDDILAQYLDAIQNNPTGNSGQILFEILMDIKRKNTKESSEEFEEAQETSPQILPVEITLAFPEEESQESEETSKTNGTEQQDREPEGSEEQSDSGINVTGDNDLRVEEDRIIQIRRPGRTTGFFN